MSDTHYKSTKNNRFAIAEGVYGIDLPPGTCEMVDVKYKQWLIRRGFATEESVNSFNKTLRGASRRSAMLAKNDNCE